MSMCQVFLLWTDLCMADYTLGVLIHNDHLNSLDSLFLYVQFQGQIQFAKHILICVACSICCLVYVLCVNEEKCITRALAM